MNEGLLLIGAAILICILMNKFLDKLPIPSLIVFIALGMCFGENGLLHISFNDYEFVNIICSASLIFIMFYGGFGTNLQVARPVIVPSVLLSTLGVAGTAGLVGLFTHFVLKLPLLESLLIGSVISSTDAASVFNILRSKKLALKYRTDSLLEIESGSNDPMSYMMTTVIIAIMSGENISIPILLFKQIAFGIASGIVVAKLAVWFLGKNFFDSQQSRTVFLFGVILVSYALPSMFNGNGYLSVYLCGILLGNSGLSQKKFLVHFFDVITDIAQVIIFFLLGLLVTPVNLPSVLLPALMVMVFLTLIARPIVSGILLLPFSKSFRQLSVVSWAGLRGVASIVFAISAVIKGTQTNYNLFNLVFCIVLLSISIQGTLLPWISSKLSMIDENEDVSKTFNDYEEESDIDFIKVLINKAHSWCGCSLSQLALPADLLIVMIIRDNTTIVPNGSTKLIEGDTLVLSARAFEDKGNIHVYEKVVSRHDKIANMPLYKISKSDGKLVILIKRGLDTIIPTGNTIILSGDRLVFAESKKN